jgi:hypothetical protein
MTDPLTTDILRMVAGLVRAGLRERGDTAALERFRDRDAWTVRLLGTETYVVSWRADGETICTIPEETVCAAVGLLRARRGIAAALRN